MQKCRLSRWAIALGFGLLSVVIALLLQSPSPAADIIDCHYQGYPLYGKVQVVESFPDLKVQIVDAFPDLKVQIVDAFPDRCGEWKFVTSFPDLKIQFVNAFPDIKIQFVTSFPGKT
ncbi:MAG TPA: hypothetical protein V6D46_00655 [Coleofasciculaceae cyanobacterium]